MVIGWEVQIFKLIINHSTKMKLLILTVLLCFTSFLSANDSKWFYTTQLNEYSSAVLKTIESDPQQALDSVKKYQPLSAVDLAQQHLLYSQVHGALDYPEKMLEHSKLGLQAIDPEAEPWLASLLVIAQVDAEDRLGQMSGNIDKIKNIITWSKNEKHASLATLALIQLSYLYIRIEDYNLALIALQEAEEIAPIEGSLINQSDVASHIAGIYVYRNEFELALPYFESTYQQEKSDNNILGMSIQLFEMGRANLELNNHESGINQLLESIELSKSIDDNQGVAYASSELAYHHIEQQAYDRAESLLISSLDLFKQAGNSYMLFDNLIQLSQLKTATGRFTEAQNHITAAEQVNQESDFRYGETSINKRKAHLLSAQGNHQEAFDLYVTATKQQAELESKFSTEKLHEIRARYEVEKNAMKNQLLAEQNSAQGETIEFQSKQSLLLSLFLVLMAGFLIVLIGFNRKLKKQSSRLHELANFDELSGLRNRSNIVGSIRRKLDKLNENDAFTLVMIDLDHFKTINDTYGHALGDKVLKLFGQLCAKLQPHTKWVGRMGGEEFLIGFEGSTPNYIHQLIDQLRIDTQNMPVQINAPGLRVSMSAGICHSHGSQRFRDILKCADEAMYQAKHNGRNQIATDFLD